MTLSDLIEHDATSVLLNDKDFAERVTLHRNGQSRSATVVFSEIDESQTIRRASVFVAIEKEIVTGSTFTRDGHTWRFLYRGQSHGGVTQWHCHEQLPVVSSLRKRFAKGVTGLDLFTHEQAQPRRAKIVPYDGEIQGDSNRRRFEAEFRIYFEEATPLPTTDELIIDSDGNSFVIEASQSPEQGTDLLYAIATRSDG